MAYTYIRAGQLVKASDLNLLGQVGQAVFQATRDAAQTMTATSAAGGAANPALSNALSWDAVNLDDLGGWSSGSPTRYTCQQAGWYKLTGGTSMTNTIASTDATICSIGWYVSGVLVAAGHGQRVTNVGSNQIIAYDARTIETLLNVGDYVELAVGHNASGATVTENTATGGVRPYINIEFVRPAG
jgi:hypothetical protein